MRRCYSVQKKALQFLGTRPGRVAVTAAAVGVVSAATWMASADARPVAVDYRGMGMGAVAEGRYAVAVPALLTATNQNPNDADAWLALGRARIAQHEWHAAKGALQKAAEVRPGHGPTEATLAWSLARLGEFDEAEVAIRRAEGAGYAPAALYALRAYCASEVRDDRRAQAATARALAIDPNNRAALVSKADLGFKQAMEKTQAPSADALADVERALAVGPADPYLELWAAHVYAWAAHKPVTVKGSWGADPAAAKARCLSHLRAGLRAGGAGRRLEERVLLRVPVRRPEGVRPRLGEADDRGRPVRLRPVRQPAGRFRGVTGD